jgi:hypothetical protein
MSDLYGDSWRTLRNRYHDPVQVDFALSEPFEIFTPEFASKVLASTKASLGSKFNWATKRTSNCVRGAPEVVQAMLAIKTRLEDCMSRLVGLPMRYTGIMDECSHVNTQLAVQDHPVDNWHQDSTPFVLVTILTEHSADPGGHLQVRRKGEHDTPYRCKLNSPGQGILMQGSQIWHMAEQSRIGERFTLVTSFHVDLPHVYDPLSLRATLGYGDPLVVIPQYLSHILTRLRKNSGLRVYGEMAEKRDHVLAMEVTKMAKELANMEVMVPTSRELSVFSDFSDCARALLMTVESCKVDLSLDFAGQIHQEVAALQQRQARL